MIKEMIKGVELKDVLLGKKRMKTCFKCHGKGHVMSKKLFFAMNMEIDDKVGAIVGHMSRASAVRINRIKKRIKAEVEKFYMKKYGCKLCHKTGVLLYPA